MSKIAWINLGTTGLDEKGGVILEVACVLTDMKGRKKDMFRQVVGHHRAETLAKMDDETLVNHLNSGLLSEVWEGKAAWLRGSGSPGYDQTLKITSDLLIFLQGYADREEDLYLGGFYTHLQRRWIRRHMQALDKRLHQRHIDMSVWNTAFPDMWIDIQKQMAGTSLPIRYKNNRALVDAEYARQVFLMAQRILVADEEPVEVEGSMWNPNDHPEKFHKGNKVIGPCCRGLGWDVAINQGVIGMMALSRCDECCQWEDWIAAQHHIAVLIEKVGGPEGLERLASKVVGQIEKIKPMSLANESDAASPEADSPNVVTGQEDLGGPF